MGSLVVRLEVWHRCEMLRDSDAAVEHCRAAARRTTSLPAKHHLTTRAVGVAGAARSTPAEQRLRALLAADRAATTDRIAALSRDLEAIVEAARLGATDDEHDPEGSTIAFERSQTSAFLADARKHLADLDSALERIDSGDYGRTLRETDRRRAAIGSACRADLLRSDAAAGKRWPAGWPSRRSDASVLVNAPCDASCFGPYPARSRARGRVVTRDP